MRSELPGSHRQKIILYYILAVVLPAIVLGYLAYRGIRNDQALREKESRRKLEMISRAFFSEMDSSLIRFMEVQNADTLSGIPYRHDHALLAQYRKDRSGQINLLKHRLLYLPEELLAVRPGKPASQNIPDEGAKLEFTEQKLPEALMFYEDKISKTTDSSEKIRALVASARLQVKLNHPERAKAMYDDIRKEYTGSLLNGQIPVALISALEILKISQATGDTVEMKNSLRESLQLLLYPPCEYEESQFDMFYQSFIDFSHDMDNVADSLIQEIDIHRKQTESVIQILTGKDLFADTGADHIVDNGKRIKGIRAGSADPWVFCLYQDNNDDTGTGIVIDFSEYLGSASDELIRAVNPNSPVDFRIEDNSGKTVCSGISRAGTILQSFPFPDAFPRFRLLLGDVKPGFFTALLKAGSGIYLYIFILIVILMVLGFILTIYTLNGELRLNRMKSEFISNVSHELKSPLTSIRMMTEMLHQKRVPTEEQKSDYYTAMLAENERLSHLIDNILDFSRMDDERKKYHFTEVDPDELLRKYIASVPQRISDPDFEIRYNCPDRVPVIRADKDAFIQVIYNLVDNAIKFSGKSKRIDIDLVSENDELKLSVRDYGIGIPPKEQERIFERFYRGDDAQRKRISGSGIGLTIVKKIIEAHKGEIIIESEVGIGSKFTVSIPLRGYKVGGDR